MDTRYIAIVKQDCETCQLVEPVLAALTGTVKLTVYSQDDPDFPRSISEVIDDRSLEMSFRYDIQTVPTLIRLHEDKETTRTEGWDREDWRRVCDRDDLGSDLISFKPGCGSRSVEPGMPERLALRFGALTLSSREIEIPDDADPVEIAYDRGWSDGLPVVPPTDHRIALMLSGTSRKPDEVIGVIPPNLVECTIEKVAINAVMAGCRPEYFPVVLAMVEGALRPEFSMHGLLATLWFSGPVGIVNGPITRRIGMNSAGNALGQGNRANATIGRALQLLIRNVGGGVPGEIDRSILGNPGKYTFCFAEDESDEGWTPLNVSRGSPPGSNSVTLFHGDGVQGIQAWASRTPEGLSRSLSASLCAVGHPKLAGWCGAILVLGPNHYEIFADAGWSRDDVLASLTDNLRRPGADLVKDANGIAEGIDISLADEMVDKFTEGYLLIVRAGGRGAGMSGIIGGWTAQRRSNDVQIVTQEINP